MRAMSPWVKAVVLAMVIAAAWWGLAAAGFDLRRWSPEQIRAFMLAQGAWAPVIYLAVFAQPLVPLPSSVMIMAGGLAFGPLWGTLGALGGATARACSQFAVARLLGREAVLGLLRGWAATLDRRIAADGFLTVLLVRLIPNVPFDLQNYGLGCSRVRFLPYAAGTFLGLIPNVAAFVYLGYALTDPARWWRVAAGIAIVLALVWLQRRWSGRRNESVAP